MKTAIHVNGSEYYSKAGNNSCGIFFIYNKYKKNKQV